MAQYQEKDNHFTNIITINPTYGVNASGQMSNMVFEINQANQIMEQITKTAQSDAVKGGFAAETWHTETFNLDAILKDKSVRAFTDNYQNSPLIKNDMVNDIVVMDNGQQVYGAQVKYYKDGDATHKAFREMRDGVAKYKDSDAFLAPSDQLNDVKASAHRAELRNQEIRPEVAQSAQDVANKATDKIQVDGVESQALTKKQAEQLGTGKESGRDFRKDMQDKFLKKSTVQQSIKAAGSAALITTVIAGSINTFRYLRLAKEGKMTADEATFTIIQNTAIAAGDSALKAGASAAVISQLARNYPQLFAGSIFKRTLSSSVVAGATVCVIDVVKNCVLFSMGKINAKQLEERTGKGIFQTGAGSLGASIGATIGSVGGPIGMIVGGLVGGMITTLAGDIALDNHIEKPFRQNLANTQNLVEAGNMMQISLDYLAHGTAFYDEFERGGVAQSEALFNSQVETMKQQSLSLHQKLNQL